MEEKCAMQLGTNYFFRCVIVTAKTTAITITMITETITYRVSLGQNKSGLDSGVVVGCFVGERKGEGDGSGYSGISKLNILSEY